MAFLVVTPRPVEPLIKKLEGKRAGYGDAYRQLEQDPCDPALGAYRLSGPLAPTVCGIHLRRGYRLAFTMQPPERPGARGRVVVLYVGKREPRHREQDIWTLLHDLFGVNNPPEGHHRPPCCDRGQPDISDVELDGFLIELRRATRGRSQSRSRRAAGG